MDLAVPEPHLAAGEPAAAVHGPQRPTLRFAGDAAALAVVEHDAVAVEDDGDDRGVAGDAPHRLRWEWLPVGRLAHRVVVGAVGEGVVVDQHRHLGGATLAATRSGDGGDEGVSAQLVRGAGFGVGLGSFRGDGCVERCGEAGVGLGIDGEVGVAQPGLAVGPPPQATVAGGSVPAMPARRRRRVGGRGHGRDVRTSPPTTPQRCRPTPPPARPTGNGPPRRPARRPAPRHRHDQPPPTPDANASCSCGIAAQTSPRAATVRASRDERRLSLPTTGASARAASVASNASSQQRTCADCVASSARSACGHPAGSTAVNAATVPTIGCGLMRPSYVHEFDESRIHQEKLELVDGPRTRPPTGSPPLPEPLSTPCRAGFARDTTSVM